MTFRKKVGLEEMPYLLTACPLITGKQVLNICSSNSSSSSNNEAIFLNLVLLLRLAMIKETIITSHTVKHNTLSIIAIIITFPAC
jgi:hypothetical protein